MISFKKAYPIVLLFLVIILGIYFRVHYIDLTRFEHEMVRDVELSNQVKEGDYLLHGSLPSVTSTAQNTFGPLSYYLMALGYFFAPTLYFYPLSPILIVILLDLLGAFLAYRIGKEFFGTTVGCLTLAFYLLSPWQIVHVSTVLSPTSFLPFFVLLFLYSTFKLVIQNKDLYVIPAVVALALQLQLHLTSFLLAFTFLLILLLYKRDVNKKYLFFGVALAFLLFLPYISYNYPDNLLGSQYNLVTQRAESAFLQTTLESFGIPILFMTPYLAPFTLGEGVSLFTTGFFDNYFLLITSFFVVLFLVSAFCFLRTLYFKLPSFTTTKQTLKKLVTSLQRNTPLRTYSLLFLLLVIPLLIFSVKGSNVTPHYFIIIFPLQIIILSIFLANLLKKQKSFALFIIALLLFSNAAYLYSYYSFVETNGGTKGLSGISYATKMEVVQFIMQDDPELQIVYYEGQKPLVRSMNYLLQLQGREPNYKLITSLTEFDKGYLVMDRYSFYSTFSGPALHDKDKQAIDALEPQSFKHLELIKKA